MAAPSLTKEERRALKKAAKAAKRLCVDAAAAPREGKPQLTAAAPQPAAGGSTVDAALGPAKRKRKAGELAAPADVADKKERKRRKRAAAAAAAAAAAVPAPSPAPAATPPATVRADADHQQPAKKRKKVDKQHPEPAPATLTSVGDVAAARAGLPVLKGLYAEHAAVAAMADAEVAAWRAERATTVTGGDWRPALEFAHAGAAPLRGHMGARPWPWQSSGRMPQGLFKSR